MVTVVQVDDSMIAAVLDGRYTRTQEVDTAQPGVANQRTVAAVDEETPEVHHRDSLPVPVKHRESAAVVGKGNPLEQTTAKDWAAGRTPHEDSREADLVVDSCSCCLRCKLV